MKILMASEVSNVASGGAARIMCALAKEISLQGHTVDLIFLEDVPCLGRWLGMEVLTFPFLVFVPFQRLVRIRGSYDLVVLHTLAGAVYASLRQIVRSLPPCILLSYGADELRWRMERDEERLGLKSIPLHSRLFYGPLVIHPTRYAIRHADHVVTPVESEKEFFIREYRADPSRISVIPFGVSREFFLSRDGVPASGRLLYLGGWEWRKGVRYLVEAFEKISVEFPNSQLSLVGTGQTPEAILSTFSLRARERVRVIPQVPPSDLPRIYAQHNIFVFPSLFEGMPLVVLEAMASGMPVVTTRACGMQDIVQDGVTGFLVPPRDSTSLAHQVVELLRDPGVCRRLGRAAQEAARGFTWDRIAHRTLQVYERFLRDSKRRT